MQAGREEGGASASPCSVWEAEPAGTSRSPGGIFMRRDRDARSVPDPVTPSLRCVGIDCPSLADITVCCRPVSGRGPDAWSRKVVDLMMSNRLRAEVAMDNPGNGTEPAMSRGRHSPRRPGIVMGIPGVRKVLREGRRAAIRGAGR